MQQATPLQLPDQIPPSRQSCPQPRPDLSPSCEAEAQPSKPQHEATLSQQALEQQVAEEKLEPRRVPRLRTVVESQAFKNVLVDEMDMMMSRAATLIQASWRGHRLRQKLVSQMMAAKAIQEAWRRFNAKRILRSSKGPEKKVEEDKDIPYHPPQQVRFQQLLPEGQKPLPQGLPQPVMASKETQFPSVDSLVTCTPQQATQKLPEALGSLKPSIATSYVLGAPSVAFLPHQTIALRFPCPMHVDTKYQQPCLLTKTIRSSCLVHIEGETVKGRHVATRPSKAGTSELVLSGRCAQVGSGPLKTQTQVHVEAEAPKPSPQVCSVPAMAKTLPQTHTAVSTAKIPSQTCPAAAVAKIPPQTRTVLMTTKIPPQAWLMSPVTQTSSQTRPAATVAYVSPQTHPAATTTKTPPQTYLTGTTTKTPPQTRSMAAMAKIPSQTCPVAKTPPQARLAAMITRTPAQIRSVATLLKTFCLPPAATGNLKVPPQAGIASGIPKSLSQTHLNTAKVKATFTEKQVDTTFEVSSHSYMAVGKSRCPPQEVGAPKAPARPHWEAEKIKVCPQRQMKMEVVSKTSMDMGVEDRSKTREQAQGKKEALRVQPQACVPVEVVTTPCQAQPATTLTKTQCQAHLPTGLAKTLSKTLSKTLYQAQLMVGLSKGQCQAQTPARLSKAQSQTQQVDKMTKAQFQAHIPAGLPKTQSQAQQVAKLTSTQYQAQMPSGLAKGQSQAQQVARLTDAKVQQQTPTRLTKAQSQTQVLARVTKAQVQAQIPAGLTKTESQAQQLAQLTRTQIHTQTPTGMIKVQSQTRLVSGLNKTQFQAPVPPALTKGLSKTQLVTELAKVQFQAQTPARLTKTESQAQQVTRLNKTLSQAWLATETAKPLCPAHQAADLSKTESQPQLATAQSCQHLCTLGLLPHAKPDDRLTQLPAPSLALGKATQVPRLPGPDTQGMLVPLLAGHPSCNIESWGDGRAARAPSPTHSHPVLCPEEATTSQLASLCAELATVLGSQEDLRLLLCKALSQGEVRAALTQVLSKEVLGATVAKALPQGMLGTALAKALSWSELGVAMSRALSRAELRAELARAVQGRLADVLSKALTEDERAALSQALCQGELGAVLNTSLSQATLQTSAMLPSAAAKPAGSSLTVGPGAVEVDCRGTPSAVWRPTLRPMRVHPSKVRVPYHGAWEEMGDGATFGGSPCLLGVSVDGSLTSREITTIHQCSLILGLNPQASWEAGAGSDLSRLCLSQVVNGDKASAVSSTGPDLPQPPRLRPPPSLWPSLIANGVGPSANQPLVTGGTAPSSHKPHVVSRVAPHSCLSPGAARGVSGRLPSSVGSGRAKRFYQSSATCGRSVCWCQLLEVNRRPPGVYRSSAARGVAPRSQPPNHKQASMGPRDLLSKETSSPPPATRASKVAHTGSQAARGLLPGSVAQVNSNLFQAPVGLSQTPSHVQESTRSWVSMSAVSQPQELATGHQMPMFNRPVAPSADTVLARSFSQGSEVPGMVFSNSQSSWQSSSSASLSTMSMASLNAIDLVEESWEGSPGSNLQMGPLLPGEVAGSPQGPGEMEEASRTHPGHMPPSPCQPATATDLVPILHHGPVTSRMSFSVHWGSESDTDVSSVPSSTDTIKSLSQVSVRTGLVRSLSLGSVTHTLHQQPSQAQTSVVSRLAPSLSHPSLAIGVVPNLAQSSATNRVAPSLPNPSVASGVAPNLVHSSVATKVAPSLAQSSVASTVAPSLAQLSAVDRVTPSLSHPSVASGVAPNLAQSSATNRVAPSLSHPSAASGVAPNLAQLSTANRVAPSLAQTSAANRVAPSLSHPSAASGVAPSLVQPPVSSRVAPGLSHPSVASGMTPNLAQTSTANRVAIGLSHPSVASGVAPSLAQLSAANRVAPSLSHPSKASGVVSSLAQPSAADRVPPSLSHPSAASGVAPSLVQPPVSSRVAPGLSHPSVASGMTPNLAQTSTANRVAPSLSHPSVASGVAPGLAQPSAASRVVPNLSQPSVASRVPPNLAQLSAANRVAPSLASEARRVAPSLSQPSVASRVAPNFFQPSAASRVPPNLAQSSAANMVAPSLVSVARRVAPSLSQPSVPSDMSHGLDQPNLASRIDSKGHSSRVNAVAPSLRQPSIVLGVTPGKPYPSAAIVGWDQSQPSPDTWVDPCQDPPMDSRVASSLQCPEFREGHQSVSQPSPVSVSTPNIYQTSVASGVSRGLGQGISVSQENLYRGMPPSMAQGTLAADTAPSMSRGNVAPGMASSMSRRTVAASMTPNMSRRSVAIGMGQSQSFASVMAPVASWVSAVGAPLIHEQASVAPGFSRPSLPNRLAENLSKGSLSSVRPSNSQLSVDLPVALDCQHPSVAIVVAPSYQQTNVLTQESIMGMPSGLAPDSVASRMTTAVAPGTVATGMAPSLAPGSVIRGIGQSLPPESVISVAQTLPPGSVANGVAQTFPPGLMINGMAQTFPPGLMINGMAQTLPPGTMASGMAQTVSPGYMASAMAQTFPPGYGTSSMAQTLPPGTMASGMAQTLSPGYMASAMAQTFSLGYGTSSMAQTLSPGSVASTLARTLPSDSVASGMAQTFPSGSMARGVAQTLPPGSVAATFTRAPPPGSVVSGVTPSLIAASVSGGKRQSLPLGPMASMAAPSLPPGSVVSGMALSVPPGSMATVGASGMAPVSMDRGLNQSLVPEPTASVVTPVPVGSLLIGITPRPYHGSLAGEGSLTPFQASHAASMTQVHPQASETSRARNPRRVPTVLSRASQMGQAVGMMPFEATESQAMLNPGELDEVSSQVSESSEESNDFNSKSAVLEATPWMYQEPMGPDVDDDHKPPLEDRTAIEPQMPLLGEVATSHAKPVASGVAQIIPPSSIASTLTRTPPPDSVASGVAQTYPPGSMASSVTHTFPSNYVASTLARIPPPGSAASGLAPSPSQAPSLAKHSMAGSTTRNLQPRSAASSRTPSRVLSPQMRPMVSRVMSQSHGISGVPSDIPMVPKSHSQATAFTTTSRSPQLPRGSSVVPSLPPEPTAQMGSPSLSKRPGVSSLASHMPQQPSLASRVVSNRFQLDTNPDTPSSPVPGDMAQNSRRESLGPRKSFRSVHGSIVSEMLDGSLARLVPLHQLQQQRPQPMQGGTRHSVSTPQPGIIRTSDRAHGTAIPRIPQGVRRVSLGYESSPSGSRRPLFDQNLQDSHSSVATKSSHHLSLTPTVLQGLTDTGVAGGQPWNAAVPSVVTGPKDSTTGPGSMWQPARGMGSWDATATDSRRSGELLLSVHTVEELIIHAVVIIQAHVRGYLVRHMIKVWHRSATIIQALWRGHVVRKQLYRLHAAAQTIQAQWRGYHTRRDHCQQMLQPGTWGMLGDWSRTSSGHRCFQSCQPRSCALCQTLCPGLGGPPSVVLLVGSSPRTCHMCGQTMPTRVVQGTGQGAGGQEGVPSQRGHGAQLAPCSPQLPHHHHKAATAIQSAWRGFLTRRHLRKQQVAAKRVQASWRGHFTRTCLTADALLGPRMAWDSPRHAQWPGV